MIAHTITANTLEELKQQYDDYCRRYHPAGYGTSWHPGPVQEQDGTWSARITRYSSCD